VRHDGSEPPISEGPIVAVTGLYGRKVLEPVLDRLAALAGRPIRLLEIPNRFFGGNTAVAGLMVGEDIIAGLEADEGPVGAYVVPDVALSGDTFIDDVPLAAIADAARAPVVVAPATAAGLVGAAR
jgi:hypothetical protein